ncbi:MAG: hypothetical protein P1V51_13675 [Deltaproteobacteria bacterium]|nr:hypothetical protein [Deltaproteobacteria bacterium]
MSDRPDLLAKALRWISDQRLQGDTRPAYQLIDEASRHFDLTPFEEQGLLSMLAGGSSAPPGPPSSSGDD